MAVFEPNYGLVNERGAKIKAQGQNWDNHANEQEYCAKTQILLIVVGFGPFAHKNASHDPGAKEYGDIFLGFLKLLFQGASYGQVDLCPKIGLTLIDFYVNFKHNLDWPLAFWRVK